MLNVINIAHRGASGQGYAPENTLSAFQQAIEIGVDVLECDVHSTKDGHLVVIHDGNLRRTTDMSGIVEEMTLAEVKKADAGLSFDPRFAGERVPTLRELLELAKGKVTTLIEVKPDNITGKVISEIESMEAECDVIVQSFHPNVVKVSQEINPQIPRALLIGGKILVKRIPAIMKLIRSAAEVGAGALHLSSRIITPPLVEESHRRGISVWAWTVDDEAEMKELIAMGVDGITSNYPRRLKFALSQKA
jgi:glycerophosphoryl diester phosphodiesterase